MSSQFDHRLGNKSLESSSGFTQRHLPQSPDQHSSDESSSPASSDRDLIVRNNPPPSSTSNIIPAFAKPEELTSFDLRGGIRDAIQAWLVRSPSPQTRDCYTRDLRTFLKFANIAESSPEQLTTVRPALVAAYRDHLREKGLGNAAIVRKLTVLRSLFSYLTTYGYTGANPLLIAVASLRHLIFQLRPVYATGLSSRFWHIQHAALESSRG
jgi:hypothetical protein